MMPFVARRGGKLVARVTAVVNFRYNSHWNELLGRLIHFEATAGEDEAATAMLEEASQWLHQRGMTAVRSGFAAFLDYPYAIDNYGCLPPFLLRHSPEDYHTYFKDAGFLTEKGMTDFTIPLTTPTLASYPAMMEAAARHGVAVPHLAGTWLHGRRGCLDRCHQFRLRAPLGMEPDHPRRGASDAFRSGADRGCRPLDRGRG